MSPCVACAQPFPCDASRLLVTREPWESGLLTRVYDHLAKSGLAVNDYMYIIRFIETRLGR